MPLCRPLLPCQPDQQPPPPGGGALAFLSVCWWLFHILIRMWSHVATLSECFCVSVAQFGAPCISGALLTPSLCHPCAAPPGLSAQLLEGFSGSELELWPWLPAVVSPQSCLEWLSCQHLPPPLRGGENRVGWSPSSTSTKGPGCGARMAWATLRHPGGRENEDL